MDTKKIASYLLLSLLVLSLACGCKPVHTLIYAPDSPKLAPLASDVPIKVVLPVERLAEADSTKPIAYFRNGVRVGSPCNYANVLEDISKKGRSLGARTARVRKIIPPDQVSSCFRMEVIFYK
jgi:hypothetical protein